MKAIGFDIGTTTISAVVVDAETGAVLETETVDNGAWCPDALPYESIQDAGRIWETARELLGRMLDRHGGGTRAIGLTGQMHGIVYLDGKGDPVSPLYTWQDGRGGLELTPGVSYARRLTELTGHTPLATGYGSVTHFYNSLHGLVPGGAAVFCTIADYIGMKLTGAAAPKVHPSMAASMGCFSFDGGRFDLAALAKAGVNTGLFPEVADGFNLLGETRGIPVAVALGDNQASFLGSVRDMEDSILINAGTGGQISVASGYTRPASPLIEARPSAASGSFLLVGSTLCAGSSYAILADFFRQSAAMMGCEPARLYDAMDEVALRHFDSLTDPLAVSTLFRGTRADASLRGSVNGLGAENFTPQHLILGVLNGMADEFHRMQRLMELPPERIFRRLIASGNGVRRNKPFRKMLARHFGMPLYIPSHKEEASFGAAVYALVSAGVFPSLEEAQRLIRYERAQDC